MSTVIKPIRTEEDHKRALARIDEIFDAEEGTPEGDELDVLVELVMYYESKTVDIGFPDPISAIEFRMDQAGLTQRDLIPYIGSRSKVSEVLSGKRDLTMSMARALHEHLGIPADVLLQKPGAEFDVALDEIEPRRFPLKEMAKRGWIPQIRDLIDHADELLRGLIDQAGGTAGRGPSPLPQERPPPHQCQDQSLRAQGMVLARSRSCQPEPAPDQLQIGHGNGTVHA